MEFILWLAFILIFALLPIKPLFKKMIMKSIIHNSIALVIKNMIILWNNLIMLNLSTKSGIDEKMSMLIINRQSLEFAFRIIETKKKPRF